MSGQHTQLTDAELLGKAIAEAAQRLGIYNGEVPLTGPHLVQLVADMERCAGGTAAAQDAQGEPDAKTWAWEQVREQVGAKDQGWTVGDACNYRGFFDWGWRYRGQFEAQRVAASPAAGVPDAYLLTKPGHDTIATANRGWAANYRAQGYTVTPLFAASGLPEGPAADMVMVPREPSDAMLRAGWNAYLSDMKGGLGRFAITYRAMLAAAPTQPKQEGGDGNG